MEWEVIDGYHERAKVFGGWLVKAYSPVEHADYSVSQGYWARTSSQEPHMSICFVPDAKHEWVLL